MEKLFTVEEVAELVKIYLFGAVGNSDTFSMGAIEGGRLVVGKLLGIINAKDPKLAMEVISKAWELANGKTKAEKRG